MEFTLTSDNFDEIVTKSDVPVLVDFWAPWCGPCQMMGPAVSELAEENTSIKVGKVNVDEQPLLAQAYGIMSIPCFVSFKDGKEYKRSSGAQPKEALLELVK